MKFKFSFWEISFNGQVLNHKMTFKGAYKWMKNWMEENLNKHYKTTDFETGKLIDSDEVIYNGRDKVYIKECVINGEGKEPRAILSFTYFHTED